MLLQVVLNLWAYRNGRRMQNTYTYCNKNEHEIKCKYCEKVLRTVPHLFKPYNVNAKQCKDCGYILYDNGFGQIIMKDEDKIV